MASRSASVQARKPRMRAGALRHPLTSLAGAAALVAACAAALVPSAADAHHSFAMFDRARTVTISGEVREFQWTNPHTWIQMVANDRGKQVEWSIEGRSPNVLSRRGWNRKTLSPGDRVAVTMYPLKNGKPGGAIISIRFPDGRVLNADTPTAVDTNEEGPR